MRDAERDLGTVQGGQRPALQLSPLPLLSTGLTSALCEVLETTGSLTENALTGGGFYSLESFLFETCNQQKLRMGYARIGVRVNSFIHSMYGTF
jgi:hypothetical protein